MTDKSLKQQDQKFKRARLMMYLLLITIFMLGFFERFAPGAFGSVLMAEFEITGSQLGMVTAMYFVTYTALQIPAGVLADRIGPKKIISIGVIIAGIGSLIFSLSMNAGILSLGRFLTGLGGATVFIGIMKFNTQWFEKRNYGMISGITLLMGNLGAAISAGPLAALLEYVTWRSTFLTTGILAILLGFLVLKFVENDPMKAGYKHVSIKTQSSNQESKNKWYVDLLKVFANKEIWPVFIAAIGTNATFYAFVGLWGVPLLTDRFQINANQASLYTTAGLIGYGVASILIGFLSDRAGLRKPFILISAMLSLIGWVWLMFLPWQLGWSGFLLYLAIGVAASQMVVSFAVVKEVVSPWVAGMALAVVNTGVFLAVSLIQPVFGWLLDTSWDGQLVNDVRIYAYGDYVFALSVMTILSLAGLITSLFVKETYCGMEVAQKSSEVKGNQIKTTLKN